MCYVLSAFPDRGNNMGGDIGQQQREYPPYQRGPPLSYMERIAEKRILEEV